MAIPDQAGYFDGSTQLIRPLSSDLWSNHTSWDSWTSWDTPNTSIVWYAPIIDLGRNGPFTLNITTVSTGQVSYKVFTSTTGLFQGEETETDIASGASNVSSFSGQYVLVVVTSTYIGTELTISSINVVPKVSSPIEVLYKDLDTSTLSGTSSARTIPLSTPLSQILEVFVTPKTVTAYNLDLYVSSSTQSTHVIPKVISKTTSGPVIALVGLDNQPRDAVVDVLIKGLGTQHMVNNNLVS